MSAGDIELKKACGIVERHLRTIGPEVQLLLNKDGAELCDLSWPGSSTGDTLFEAFEDARQAES